MYAVRPLHQLPVETSIFPTWTQRILATPARVFAVLLPFNLPVINQIPLVRYLGDPTGSASPPRR